VLLGNPGRDLTALPGPIRLAGVRTGGSPTPVSSPLHGFRVQEIIAVPDCTVSIIVARSLSVIVVRENTPIIWAHNLADGSYLQ
jgi:hypothetical protein